MPYMNDLSNALLIAILALLAIGELTVIIVVVVLLLKVKSLVKQGKSLVQDGKSIASEMGDRLRMDKTAISTAMWLFKIIRKKRK